MISFLQSAVVIVAGFILIIIGLWSAQGAFASITIFRKTDQKFVAFAMFFGGLICLFVTYGGIELIRKFA